MLIHHSKVRDFFCSGGWGWKLKRCSCRKIRWPYVGAERKKWNKVRTEPLLHCRWPKKIKLKKEKKKMAKDNYLLSYALRYPSFFLLKCREINLKREFLFPLLQRGQTSLSLLNFSYNPFENLQTKVGKYWKDKSNLLVLQLEMKIATRDQHYWLLKGRIKCIST